jgi:hypothetical protein
MKLTLKKLSNYVCYFVLESFSSASAILLETCQLAEEGIQYIAHIPI